QQLARRRATVRERGGRLRSVQRESDRPRRDGGIQQEVVERNSPCARRRGARRGAVLCGVVLLSVHIEARGAPANEWPTYGHDPGGMPYSPLPQIDPSNVSGLQTAWTYSMRPAEAPAAAEAADDSARRAAEGVPSVARRRSRLGSSQATPLVIDG